MQQTPAPAKAAAAASGRKREKGAETLGKDAAGFARPAQGLPGSADIGAQQQQQRSLLQLWGQKTVSSSSLNSSSLNSSSSPRADPIPPASTARKDGKTPFSPSLQSADNSLTQTPVIASPSGEGFSGPKSLRLAAATLSVIQLDSSNSAQLLQEEDDTIAVARGGEHSEPSFVSPEKKRTTSMLDKMTFDKKELVSKRAKFSNDETDHAGGSAGGNTIGAIISTTAPRADPISRSNATKSPLASVSRPSSASDAGSSPSACSATAAKEAGKSEKVFVARVARGPDNQVVLPLLLPGNVTIQSLGVIDTRPAFRSKNNLWPIGFHCVRFFPSTKNSAVQVPYTSTIETSNDAPVFKIVPGDAPDAVVIASSASAAWREMLGKIRLAQGKSETAIAKISVSGPEMYGLSNPQVRMLLQELDGAAACSRTGILSAYSRVEIEESDDVQAVASSMRASARKVSAASEEKQRKREQDKAATQAEREAKKLAEQQLREEKKQQTLAEKEAKRIQLQAEREQKARAKAAEKKLRQAAKQKEQEERRAAKEREDAERKTAWEEKQKLWADKRAAKEAAKAQKSVSGAAGEPKSKLGPGRPKQALPKVVAKNSLTGMFGFKVLKDAAADDKVAQSTRDSLSNAIDEQHVRDNDTEVQRMDAAVAGKADSTFLSPSAVVRELRLQRQSDNPFRSARTVRPHFKWIWLHDSAQYRQTKCIAQKQKGKRSTIYLKTYSKLPWFAGALRGLTSEVISARRPLAKDPSVEYDLPFDLGVDRHGQAPVDFSGAYERGALENTHGFLEVESEGEAEPEDGEDILDSDAEPDTCAMGDMIDVTGEGEDDFVVADGYLSMSEGFHSSTSDSDDDDLRITADPLVNNAGSVDGKMEAEFIDVDGKDSPNRPLRQPLQAAHNVTVIVPMCTGPIWTNAPANSDAALLAAFSCVPLANLSPNASVDLLAIHTTFDDDDDNSGEQIEKIRRRSPKSLPEDMMPEFIGFVHGSVAGIQTLVKCFLELLAGRVAAGTPTKTVDDAGRNRALPSKRQLDITIRQIAIKERRPEFKRERWFVKDAVAAKYSVSLPFLEPDAPIQNADAGASAAPIDRTEISRSDNQDNQTSSIWRSSVDPHTAQVVYYNLITQETRSQRPQDVTAIDGPTEEEARKRRAPSAEPCGHIASPTKRARQSSLLAFVSSPPSTRIITEPAVSPAHQRQRIAPIALD